MQTARPLFPDADALAAVCRRHRIRHMVEAIETAQRFIEGRTRDDLDTDRMLLFALVRVIEIVGGAASRVSADARSAMPAVPCQAAIAMRNRLIHACFDIDRDFVRKTGAEEIARLLPHLQPVLPKA